MKHNRIILMTLSLLLICSLCVTAVASALSINTASTGSDYDAERGVQWEMLNNEYYITQDLLNEVGNDFTDYYYHTVKNAAHVAEDLLNSTASTTAQLKEMAEELRYLRSERNNPSNHARFGYYTVAFTNTQNWSEPIYLYNWSDDGGEILPWPGEAMTGGYTNEYGEMQYYAFVPMDVPNIVFSSNQVKADGQYTAVPTVRVQTEDITVFGNTGYYPTGERDGAKYKVGEWELKSPDYKQYYFIDDPTDEPTVPSTEKPTEAPTQKPTVIADLPTEPSTEFNIDDYLPKYDGILDFYEQSYEDQVHKDLHELITRATVMLAPGNNYTAEYCEKLLRVRNFAVSIYHHRESADHELIGASKMLEAAIDDKSYEEIIDISRQWFYMADETPDPTEPPTQNPTSNPTEPSTTQPTQPKAEFEPGCVLVSLQSGTASVITEALKGFEIESTRLLTPGSATQIIYKVDFTEKTEAIVWRAIDILKQVPAVKIAEPNYYGSYTVLTDEEAYRDLLNELKTPAFTADSAAEGGRKALGELLQSIYDSFYVKAPEGMVSEHYKDKITLLEAYRRAKKLYDADASADETYYQTMNEVGMLYFALIPPGDITDNTEPIIRHLFGDADDDGHITIFDATRIQRVLVGYDPDRRETAERYASITGDSLNILDATIIQRHLAGFKTGYPIGEFID